MAGRVGQSFLVQLMKLNPLKTTSSCSAEHAQVRSVLTIRAWGVVRSAIYSTSIPLFVRSPEWVNAVLPLGAQAGARPAAALKMQFAEPGSGCGCRRRPSSDIRSVSRNRSISQRKFPRSAFFCPARQVRQHIAVCSSCRRLARRSLWFGHSPSGQKSIFRSVCLGLTDESVTTSSSAASTTASRPQHRRPLQID